MGIDPANFAALNRCFKDAPSFIATSPQKVASSYRSLSCQNLIERESDKHYGGVSALLSPSDQHRHDPMRREVHTGMAGTSISF